MSTRSTPVPPTADPARSSMLGQQLVIFLAAGGSRLSERIAERLGDADLAHNVPVLVLCEIALRGPLRPRDLLEPTHLTSGAMTKQLDHLEQLGLVKRSYGTVTSDRRASVVSLTARGRRAAETIGRAVEDHIDEIAAIRDGLSRLLDE